ncbi:MAG: DUF4097 domain-containing protein [Clostridia bacterium]|nr:DUF4097 domain-containing protein [Clostridia bacterium]
MKNIKYNSYLAAEGVNRLDCEFINCNVKIYGTDGDDFRIERAHHSYIRISEHDGILRLKQLRKPFFHKAEIIIYAPASALPDVGLKIKRGSLEIDGARCGNLHITGGEVSVSIADSSFSYANVNLKSLKLDCADIAFENSFICAADSGKVIMENSLCHKMDLTVRCGNLGISRLKCRDGAYTVEEGSINLTLDGEEEDYSLSLLAKNGTCNRENASGGAYALKAYTGNGNIVVDFNGKPAAEVAAGA